MPIMEGPAGTPEDTTAIVWDLVDGFALLSAIVAEQYNGSQARPLEAALCRLSQRAEAIGKNNLAARLDSARGRLLERLPEELNFTLATREGSRASRLRKTNKTNKLRDSRPDCWHGSFAK